jgi:hypothetical protein
VEAVRPCGVGSRGQADEVGGEEWRLLGAVERREASEEVRPPAVDASTEHDQPLLAHACGCGDRGRGHRCSHGPHSRGSAHPAPRLGTAALVMVVVTSVKQAPGLVLPHRLWTGADFLDSRVATAFWCTDGGPGVSRMPVRAGQFPAVAMSPRWSRCDGGRGDVGRGQARGSRGGSRYGRGHFTCGVVQRRRPDLMWADGWAAAAWVDAVRAGSLMARRDPSYRLLEHHRHAVTMAASPPSRKSRAPKGLAVEVPRAGTLHVLSQVSAGELDVEQIGCANVSVAGD